MKKTLALAFAFGVASAFAQDLTSKKGEPILPEAGDWSIGIDASPFLNYAGNLFSGATSSNGAPTWNFLNNNYTIIGKMFKDEKTAYRGILRIGLNSASYKNNVDKDFATAPTFPATTEQVEDKLKMGQTFVGLGGGIEMRRGKTRLQGYYGGDAMFWMSSSKATMTYGNVMSSTGTASQTTTPNSTDWGTLNWSTLAPGSISEGASGSRTTSWKSGSTIGLAVRGFIGAEYFVLPKISIGGEFGWGIGISTTGASKSLTETVGGTTATVAEVESIGSKSSRFWIDTDQNATGTASASLRMNFHF
jgi:hypothetical protein